MKTLYFDSDRLVALDQRLLPLNENYLELRSYQEVAKAIRDMAIRGAPAIAIAASYGVVLGAMQLKANLEPELIEALRPVFKTLAQSRPTARNLVHALEHLERVVSSAHGTADEIVARLLAEANAMHSEELLAEQRLSELGSNLIPAGSVVLTHCNTGALATAGYGTALGIIKTAHGRHHDLEVIITETRPQLQGSRLTAWELSKLDIPFTLITDSMAGYFISKGSVSCIIVGADCIARNGDVANKIGTYTLAILAKEHGVPFYVAAPTSTIDINKLQGAEISIEERSPDEVTHIGNQVIAPPGIRTANPAFDITPHHYISAIITEKGICEKPSEVTLGAVLE